MLSNESPEVRAGKVESNGETNTPETNEVKSMTLSLAELSVLKMLVREKLAWTQDYLTYQQPSEGGTNRKSVSEIASLSELLIKLDRV